MSCIKIDSTIARLRDRGLGCKKVFIAEARYTGDQSVRQPKQTRIRQEQGQDTKLGQVHVESRY